MVDLRKNAGRCFGLCVLALVFCSFPAVWSLSINATKEEVKKSDYANYTDKVEHYDKKENYDKKEHVDDEDYGDIFYLEYQADEGSGDEGPETTTQYIQKSTVHVTPEVDGSDIVYYRVSVTFLTILYNDALENQDNDDFKQEALEVETAIDALYENVPGNQYATVLAFSPSGLVTFDITSVGNNRDSQIFAAINSAIDRNFVGTYAVDSTDFTFIRLDVVPPPTDSQPPVSCDQNQFSCLNRLQCVEIPRVCDQFPDCLDSSDEQNCPSQPTSGPCRSDQYRCQSGQCIDSFRQCDLAFDCIDGSDEYECVSPAPRTNIYITPGDQNSVEGERVEYFCVVERPNRLTPSRWVSPDGREITLEQGSDDPFVSGSTEPFVIRSPLSPQGFTLSLVIPAARLIDEGTYTCLYEVYSRMVTLNVESRPIVVTDVVDPVVDPILCRPLLEATCQNLECIPKEYLCDGDPDCSDGSDEIDCGLPTDRVCEPNEFRCRNGRCAQKIWLCDGDDDCTDNSDEEDCPLAPPGSPCPSTFFQCLDREKCIPNSFVCDNGYDCTDRSDEISCGTPFIISGPTDMITVNVGDSIMITCEAAGKPTPIISWRLNWGHIPNREGVTTTTVNGRGVLTITNIQENEAGAYSCEAINNQGFTFAVPDCIVVVQPGRGLCSGNKFNDDALVPQECADCFCFGVTDLCTSSSYYMTQESLQFTSADPQGLNYGTRVDGQFQQFTPDSIFISPPYREASLIYPREESLYWSLPTKFLGDKVTSYGGILQYTVEARPLFNQGDPVDIPDVIIQGNGVSLVYYYSSGSVLSNIRISLTAPLTEAGWQRELAPRVAAATRPDMMMALENIDRILIKASYFRNLAFTGITDVIMEYAVSEQVSDRRATLVEQCQCPRGYLGTSCQQCGPLFDRDPLGAGYLGSCIPRTIGGDCNPDGSTSSVLPGRCDCKNNVEGVNCDQCAPFSFYLSGANPEGCITCFCNGVTSSCSSSSYFRSQITARFTNAGDTQGFELGLESGVFTVDNRRLFINPSTSTLFVTEIGREIPADISNMLYWILPSNFLNNKVTSYGGNLQFQLQYAIDTVETEQYMEGPDVILKGNNINLYYRFEEEFLPNSQRIFVIPFYENYWTRFDGQPATRAMLMQALADLDTLRIRAIYRLGTDYTGISDVTLDVALPQNTGRDQAWAVEQCQCPTGYIGLSCQDCAPGYARTGGGLYLGTCSPCRCNGHSDQCEPETGICQNCQGNTQGEHCENCISGYYGDPLSDVCLPCPCPLTSGRNQFSPTCYLDGDNRPTCDACPPEYEGRNCERCRPPLVGNPLNPGDYCRVDLGPDILCPCGEGIVPGSPSYVTCGVERCQCKANVQGDECNSCKEEHFYLSAENEEGCLRCFCMGITYDCVSSGYYRDSMAVTFQSPNDALNFVLVTRGLINTINSGFMVNVAANSISYDGFPQLIERETYFWQLPPRFNGNKITAYGGRLIYSASYIASGQHYSDMDASLKGNDITIYYQHQVALQSGASRRFEIPLTESAWRRLDGQPMTREHMLMVLADIDHILLRATYSYQTQQSTIRDIQMEIAVPQMTSQFLAESVEQCRCPRGYTGLSCEDCDRGFTRSGGGLYLGLCEPCQCNGHSDECDPETGTCTRCQHNTGGERCEQCLPGFYGDATSGTPRDCQMCACPLSINSNQFSDTCILDLDGDYTCNSCQVGYTGRHCERCAAGYSGNPMVPGDSCTRGGDGRPRVNVAPSRVTGSIGSTILLECFALGRFTQLEWSRADGRPLSPRAVLAGSGSQITITLPNLERSDEGSYLCTGTNQFGSSSAESRVTVQGAQNIQVIIEEPTSLEAQVGQSVTFICRAISQVSYIVAWTRVGGSLPSGAQDIMGTLRLPNLRPEDAGTYKCTGSNLYGMAEDFAQLTVGGVPQPITIRIEPRYLEVTEGDFVEFQCITTGSPRPTLRWHGGQGGSLSPSSTFDPNTGIFRIPSAQKSDEAEYYCEATPVNGEPQSIRTVLYVGYSNSPSVSITTPEVTAEVGDQALFYCSATGDPEPTIEWSKENTQVLPEHMTVQTGYLIIRGVKIGDSGNYICTATNEYGTQSATGKLEVSQGLIGGIVPKEQVASVGETVTFTCTLFGQLQRPGVDFQWSKDGQQSLSPDHQVYDNILRILDVRLGDAGTYTCLAIDGDAMMTDSAQLRVEDTRPISIYIEPDQQVATIGGTASFTCQINSPTPDIPSIVWNKEGQATLFPNHQVFGNILRIVNVSPEDRGTYVCTAVTGDIVVTEARARLDVEDLPLVISITPEQQVAAIGGTASFTCNINNQRPGVTLEWSKEGQASLSPNHQVYENILRIVNVSPEDRGSYVCTVGSAETGLQRARAILEVEDSRSELPVITMLPDPPRVTVQVGGNAYFRCQIDAGYPNPTIKWERSDGQQLSSRAQVQSTDLSFFGATGEDQGSYVCTATNSAGSVQGTVFLAVLGQDPQVTLNPSQSRIQVVEGQSVLVECIGEGDPTPTVSWEYPSTAQFPGSIDTGGQVDLTKADLQIFSAALRDTGEYTCTATTPSGSAQKSIYIDVIGGSVQQPPTVRIIPESAFQVIGDEVRFICETDSPYPPEWLRVGSSTLPPTHSVENGVLTISQVTEQDGGSYYCRVRNDWGYNQAATFLTVSGPPSSVEVSPTSVTVAAGDTVRVQCYGDGSHPLSYEWSKVGNQLPEGAHDADGMLMIPLVTAIDAGQYRCLCSNKAGSKEAYVQISVNVPPTMIVKPETVSKSVGDSVEIICETGGTPVPAVQWFREDYQPLPNGHFEQSGVLRIDNLQPGDAGRYMCVARNSAGEQRGYSTLKIMGPPKVEIYIHSPVQMVSVGESITFECVAVGTPSPDIQWTKLDSELPPQAIIEGGKLTIPTTRISDEGTYTCIASNPISVVQSNVMLYVQAPVSLTSIPRQQEVPMGGQAKFTCVTSGSPAPLTQWYKEEGELPGSHTVNQGVLTIYNAMPRDTGTYVCRGISELDEILESRSRLSIGALVVPQFTQNPISYIGLETLESVYERFTIEISFRPDITDGLILYNGQSGEANSPRDFVSFGLVRSYVEYRFELGGGHALIRSRSPLTLNEWHTVVLTRDGREGSMTVDGREVVNGTSNQLFRGLSLDQNLYLGGVPNFADLPITAGFSNGFVGCISRLVVNEEEVDIADGTKSLVGISNCQSCFADLCQNGGSCREANTNLGFLCDCTQGFAGSTCQNYGHSCYPGACAEGSTCQNQGSNDFICICPQGWTGSRCQEIGTFESIIN